MQSSLCALNKFYFLFSVRDVVRNDGSVIGLYHRVDHEGFKGSVKFIGTLPDTTGKVFIYTFI